MGEKSKLRRTISKWANADDMHARELRETTRKGACNLISDSRDREPVRLRGTLKNGTVVADNNVRVAFELSDP